MDKKLSRESLPYRGGGNGGRSLPAAAVLRCPRSVLVGERLSTEPQLPLQARSPGPPFLLALSFELTPLPPRPPPPSPCFSMTPFLVVKLNGGRHVQGILRGFDPFMNLVIDECVEMAPGGQQNNIGMVVSAGGGL